MDLQPQPAAIPPQPASSSAHQPAAAGQSTTTGTRIRIKHQSLPAAPEAEAAAADASEEAAEPVVPVRSSVRVKLRRAGSAGKQLGSSSALSGKQLSVAHGKRSRHSHRTGHSELEEDEMRAGRQHGTGADQVDMVGSRMHSSSGPGSANQDQMPAADSGWQAANKQTEPVNEASSAMSSQAAASAAASQSESEEQRGADQAAADSGLEAAQGGHAEHAAPSSSHGVHKEPESPGDEQPIGQSHVTGAPHSQAQQGRLQAPRDTAHLELNQQPQLAALSTTESSAGPGLPLSNPENDMHVAGGDADPDQHGEIGTPEVAAEGAAISSEHDRLCLSSAEVASPQQPQSQTVNDGSNSVDQRSHKMHAAAQGGGADDNKAESQLRAQTLKSR